MRILVYEHLTANANGGESGAQSPLLQEGEAMIRALVNDLMRVQDAEISALRSPFLPATLRGRVMLAEPDLPPTQMLQHAMRDFDAVWLVAPETGGCLEALACQVLEEGRLLLGCAPAAIRICGSKLHTARLLSEAHIACAQSYRSMVDLPPEVSECIVKPDDGAGCLDTYLLNRPLAALRLQENFIVQPWVEGDARSISMLCTEDDTVLLCVNRQRVRRDGERLIFEGVDIDAVQDEAGEIAQLARRVHAAIPGLNGFVGVDYVQTAQGPVIIEINPRLTSAYVGMSRKLGFNVATLALDRMREQVT